jgi:hypothetical protein
MTKMSLIRTALLLTALLVVGACSKSDPVVVEDSGSTTTTTVQPGTTTAAPPAAGGSTTTTALPTPKDSAGFQAQLRDAYGVTFTTAQGECLGDAFAAKPALFALLPKDAEATVDQSNELVALFVRCFNDVPAASHAIIETVVKEGKLRAEAGPCFESVLSKLSPDDLAKFMAGEQTTQTRLEPQLRAACASVTG